MEVSSAPVKSARTEINLNLCPFCSSDKTRPTTYPLIVFNNKEFVYLACTECGLVYLNNFPDGPDYELMYPPSYQRNEVETDIQQDPYKKLFGIRFSYGYQFDLIKRRINRPVKILDYGCGTGHFLANALHHGFECDGAEFNPEYIEQLKKHFANSSFYTINEVLSPAFNAKYDVIRLSNVLEHLTTPKDIIGKLVTHLNPGGILLVEGPIEENFCIATSVRKFYFFASKLLRPNRTVTAPPYHIFFSNAKNQRRFFKDCDLSELDFDTTEAPWPFPPSVKEAKGITGKMTAIIARISMGFTKLGGRNWGNTFIYAGTKK